MSKNGANDPQKVTSLSYDPMDIAIMGGKDALPEGERGPLDTLTDKAHPLYDERLKLKLTADWIANIKTRGVRENPNVVMLDGVPFLVNGRQRVRAARVANKQLAAEKQPLLRVTCSVTEVDDVGMLSDMIALNVHTDDPAHVKIAKLKRLVDRGVTPEAAAVLFATRPATIKAWLQYDATAIPEVKKAVAGGKIPQTTGADIARLPAEKQPKALESVLKSAVTSKSDRKERTGNASKAKRAIARAGGKGAAISDKKTLKKFLAAVESQEHPKAAKDSVIMWWAGVEAALHFVLGNDGVDKRLADILEQLDEGPSNAPDSSPTDEDIE